MNHARPAFVAPPSGESPGASPRENLDESIPQRFERFASDCPTRAAVKTVTCEATFGELSRASNRLARAILARRDNSPHPIALLVEQGAAQAVGILGILKADSCYVSLNPSHPRQRLQFILEDSRVDLVVTNTAHLSLARMLSGGRIAIVDIDALDPAIPGDDLDLRVLPEHCASISYTSGSTGKPKGVIHTHRSTLQLGRASGAANIASCDRVATVGSSISFNRVLLHGATAFTWSVREHGFLRLAEWLRAEAVTVLLTVPSVFRNFASTLARQQRFPHLRRIVLTGEALYRKDAAIFRQHFPPECLLVNELGSTETKSYAQFLIDHHVAIDGDIVPVGFPLEGRQVHLLNADGSAADVGQVGEIVVASRHLSPGYWGQPELTDARFRPNPVDPGERVYRTGDLAYRLADGCLVHVGRKDFQLKVRGQRTELAEIEAALRHLDGIHEAVVVARDDPSGGKRLVAYVVPDSACRPTITALASGLKEKLPEHMIPAAFLLLDKLPMTPNGKVDRLALPAPGRSRPNLSVPYEAPRDAVEESIARIWTDVLDLDVVGIRDDFFELGGDSLRATMVHARLLERLQVELPLRDLLGARTIESLGLAITSSARQSPGPRDDCHPIPRLPRGRGGCSAASFAQQRLWLQEQIDPSAAYTDAIAWRLVGQLDVGALESALNAVVSRHEVLRTTIASAGEEVMQIIAEACSLKLPVIVLDQHSTEADRSKALDDLINQQATRTFDLSRDAMLRACLVRLGDQDHALVLTLHHIATDGWSTGVLARELSTFYNATRDGVVPMLPELHVQYADYAAWQRNRLSGESLQAQLAYWKRQLDGAPEDLELPTDRPRSHVKSLSGGKHAFQFSQELSNALREISQQGGTTLFATLAAAFATLLGRCSGSNDIVFGTPIAGRRRVELEGLIGFFVNTLPFRVDMAGDPTFLELLGRVHETSCEAFTHQDVPFERLVEELRPRRRPGHSPLFDVMFALQNAPRSALELQGLESRRIPVHNGTSKFDLTVTMVDGAGGLRGNVVYREHLFEVATIRRLCGQFETLLQGIVAHPRRRVSDLPLLTPADRRQLLDQWSHSPSDPPVEDTIHRLFEAQVEATPDLPAVVCDDHSLTYRQLNDRANRLARRLRGLGVGPRTLVAISLERSIDLVVGFLGILKAGAAYVPLDPCQPTHRLSAMLTAAGAPVLVTQSQLRACFSDAAARVICIDDPGDPLDSGLRADDSTPEVSASDLAYVIFTSGSTGAPKQVAIRHRAVVRLVKNTNYIELTPRDVVAQISNASFDAVTFEIWGALLNGAKLVVIPREVVLSPHELAARVQRDQVSVMFVTTALFKQIAAEHPAAFSTVRCVLFGGEVADPRCVREVLAHGPPARLLHVYGPTEATTFATWHLVEQVPDDALSIPIGKAISNTYVYVLDDHLRPVPIGVCGELCLGGPGLAAGYLGDPELTARKFVPNPFGGSSTDRLYRTGDYVRWRADGNLEFVGRRDQQVKIRGFRVEPSEVEAVLTRHPMIRAAAVVAREDAHRGRYLVAYFVPRPGESPPTSELRAFLRDRLPDHLVPTALLRIDHLPLTPNGKLNRQALPDPEIARPEAEADFAPPQGEWEQRLAAIWMELLNLPGIGAHDNFFELGGHSLLAFRVLTRIEESLGSAPTLKSIFEHPTLRQFASLLEASAAVGAAPAIVRLRGPIDHATHDRAPIVIAPSLFGHTLELAPLFQRAARDRAVYALEVTGNQPYWMEQPSLDQIARGFSAQLRSRFSTGRLHIIGYSFGGMLAYEIGRQLEALGTPPISVTLLDRRVAKIRGAWRWHDVLALLGNLPRWLINATTCYTPRQFVRRILKRLMPGHGSRHAPLPAELADALYAAHLNSMYELASMPQYYRQRLIEGYRAIREYHPSPTTNRTVYLRCRVRALWPDDQADGGWGAFVPPDKLEIVPIGGEHSSALHPRRLAALAHTLDQCIRRSEAASTSTVQLPPGMVA
jgi:amino acid adenylation domain-containing protein